MIIQGTIAHKVIAKFITQLDSIILECGTESREFRDSMSCLITNYRLFSGVTESQAWKDCQAAFPQLNSRWS